MVWSHVILPRLNTLALPLGTTSCENGQQVARIFMEMLMVKDKCIVRHVCFITCIIREYYGWTAGLYIYKSSFTISAQHGNPQITHALSLTQTIYDMIILSKMKINMNKRLQTTRLLTCPLRQLRTQKYADEGCDVTCNTMQNKACFGIVPSAFDDI